MKELILICAVAVVFALCFLLLKKLDIFFGDSSRTVISSDRPSMLSIAFEHTEEVSLLNDLLERFSRQAPGCELSLFYGSAKDIQKQLNTGKIDFGFIRADVNTEPDQKLGSFLFLLDENILACEPLGLPVMPLNSQKFLVNALWKKGSRSGSRIIYPVAEGCIPGKIVTVHNVYDNKNNCVQHIFVQDFVR